jgi:3-oxoadipate enol-lactonase
LPRRRRRLQWRFANRRGGGVPISKANGVDIYYETAGSGPPLVLIHAMPFDHNLWLYQVERFSAHFTTIAMDLRGWGRSAKPHASFTLEDMGADVMGVLGEVAASREAIVMGCSVGSKIALMLAVDHPQTFRAAVLVGGNSGLQLHFDHRIAAYKAEHAAGRLRDYHRGHLRYGVTQAWADSPIGRYLVEGFVRRGAALDPDAIANVFRAVGQSNLRPKLPAYATPTLIINGEHDNARPGGTETAGLIKQSEHVVLPNTGHCCMIEDPAAFNKAVRLFLKRRGLWP